MDAHNAALGKDKEGDATYVAPRVSLKITDFDISVEVYENVFWFEIPVDNILEM